MSELEMEGAASSPSLEEVFNTPMEEAVGVPLKKKRQKAAKKETPLPPSPSPSPEVRPTAAASKRAGATGAPSSSTKKKGPLDVRYEVKPESKKGQPGVIVQQGVEVYYGGVFMGKAISAIAHEGSWRVEGLDVTGGEAILRDIRWEKGSSTLRKPLPISIVFVLDRVEVRGLLSLARVERKNGGRSFWHLLTGTYEEVCPYVTQEGETSDVWIDIPNHPLRRPEEEMEFNREVLLY